MKKDSIYKGFVSFLCFSLVLLTSGLPRVVADAKERDLPIGEMISSGKVTFEARKNVWKRVEPSHFPIFQGVKMQTDKGHALIVLTNDSQVEVGENSLFSLQPDNQFHLFRGRLSFRIPPRVNLNFRVGNLTIGKPRRMQAARDLVFPPKNQEAIGSVVVRPNGAVTVKSARGPLSVQNQESVVLAALSSNESITIPSATAFGDTEQVVALGSDPAADMYPTGKAATEELLGLSTKTWMLIALAATALVGGGLAWYAAGSDDDEEVIPYTPACP